MANSIDPYAGYVGHDVDLVLKGIAVIMPKYTTEKVAEGTNPAPGFKPSRLRVFYNKDTRLVTRIVAG